MFKKLVLHKHSGSGFGELFSSMVGILQLSVVVLFYIGTIQVLNRQVNMDSVIRGFMLQLESQGYLTEQQQDELKAQLVDLGAYDGTYTFGSESHDFEIVIEGWDSSTNAWSEDAINTAAGYGKRVGLRVTVTVPDNEYHPQYWLGNIIQQKLRTKNVVITKVQTAKY